MASFEQRLGAHQRQEMALSPRMLQAVEVLQLPVTELATYLMGAFEENEALAIDDDHWRERHRTEAPGPGAAGREAADRHDEWLRSQPDRSGGLHAALEEQLALRDVEPKTLSWVRFVVQALDPAGYLSAGDEELLAQAREAGLEGGAGALGRAIGVVQSLEPRGIGGRNAVEALLLQLDPRDPDYGLLCLLLEDFLEDVSRNKLPAVARAMGLGMAELEGLLDRLRDLKLRPAGELEGSLAPALHPDVLVEPDEDGFRVRLADSGLPPLRVDAHVRAMSRDRALDGAVRARLRGSIDRARWLLKAVEQRQETLQRVCTALFAHQLNFLQRGPAHLRPLRMGDVAEWVQVHTSTVSRAVAGKYAETPWGLFALRWFFQAGAGDDGQTARNSIRELVGEIVAAEDGEHPLSDDAIVDDLGRRGHRVARRTVAKYRAELGIPSSYRRRRY